MTQHSALHTSPVTAWDDTGLDFTAFLSAFLFSPEWVLLVSIQASPVYFLIVHFSSPGLPHALAPHHPIHSASSAQVPIRA